MTETDPHRPQRPPWADIPPPQLERPLPWPVLAGVAGVAVIGVVAVISLVPAPGDDESVSAPVARSSLADASGEATSSQDAEEVGAPAEEEGDDEADAEAGANGQRGVVDEAQPAPEAHASRPSSVRGHALRAGAARRSPEPAVRAPAQPEPTAETEPEIPIPPNPF